MVVSKADLCPVRFFSRHTPRVIAPSICAGGRAAATDFELQFALPPVATRNGLASPAQIGAPLIQAVNVSSSVIAGVLVGLLGRFFLFGLALIFEAVAAAGDGDGLGVVEEAIQDGTGGGHVAQELAPVFDGPVAGHDGGTVFVAAHDHFQEVFAGVFGQGLESHVIDDQKVGLEIAAQDSVLLVEGFVFEEVAHQIEDGAVEDLEVELDGFVAQGLGQVRFADPGRADEQKIGGLANELAGGQVVDLFAGDGGIEAPVKVLQRFEAVKVSGLGAAAEQAFLAHVEFVLEQDFQELFVAQAVGRGFLQAQAHGARQAGEPQLFEGGFQVRDAHQ